MVLPDDSKAGFFKQDGKNGISGESNRMDIFHPEYHFKRLLDHAQDGIFITSFDKIVYVNEYICTLLGFTRNELEMMSPWHLVNLPDRKTIQAHMFAQLSNQDCLQYELDLLRQDGTTVPCEIILEIMPHTDILMFQGNLRDISQIKAMKTTMSLMMEMSASIAHEIRNPMTTVRGLTQLLSVEDQTHKEYYDLMIEELDRATKLLNDFLRLARGQVCQRQRLEINHFISHCMNIVYGQLVHEHIHLIKDLDDAHPAYVIADADKLKQTFINISRNAIEAMEEEGILKVSSRVFKDHVVVSFQDNGRGISPQDMTFILQPFYSTKENGTGLGLSVSSRIINDSGGKLHIDSELNQGTTVTITLPVSYVSETDSEGQ